jgi:hypothetical protein
LLYRIEDVTCGVRPSTLAISGGCRAGRAAVARHGKSSPHSAQRRGRNRERECRTRDSGGTPARSQPGPFPPVVGCQLFSNSCKMTPVAIATRT